MSASLGGVTVTRVCDDANAHEPHIWRPDMHQDVSCPGRADIAARLVGMAMTPHERAKAANAALTTDQRSAAGKARAAMLHHPVTKARQIAKAWPELSDEDRRAVRRELRAAGVIA